MSIRGFRTLLRELYDCESCGSLAGAWYVTKDGAPTQPHQDRWDRHAALFTASHDGQSAPIAGSPLEGCFDCG